MSGMGKGFTDAEKRQKYVVAVALQTATVTELEQKEEELGVELRKTHNALVAQRKRLLYYAQQLLKVGGK